MIETLPVLVRRLIALGMLACLVVVIGGIIIVPLYAAYVTGQGQLTELATLKSRLDTIVTVANASSKDFTDAERAKHKSMFVPAGETSVVLAELQGRLRAVLNGKNCEVSSVRNLSEKLQGEQLFLGISLQVRCPMRGMRDALHLIETGKPYLFVDRAVLRLEEHRGAVREKGEEALTAMFGEFDIYGAKWIETAVPAAGAAQ